MSSPYFTWHVGMPLHSQQPLKKKKEKNASPCMHAFIRHSPFVPGMNTKRHPIQSSPHNLICSQLPAFKTRFFPQAGCPAHFPSLLFCFISFLCPIYYPRTTLALPPSSNSDLRGHIAGPPPPPPRCGTRLHFSSREELSIFFPRRLASSCIHDPGHVLVIYHGTPPPILL